jgi:3',5'-cyclic-AMP phosphodiesterase
MTSFRVLQISDTHVLADADGKLYRRDVNGNLQATITAAQPSAPFDLIILTGDISEDGSSTSYERVKAMFDTLEHHKLLAIAGNHDDPVALSAVFDTSPHDMGNWRVLPVNSHWDSHVEGKLEQHQVASLTKEVAALTAGEQFALIAVHHPPHFLCQVSHCALSEPEQLMTIAANDTVRLVISGHVHDDYAHRVGSTLFSTCPSTCIGFDHDPAGHKASALPPGAVIYELHGDGSVSRRSIYVA